MMADQVLTGRLTQWYYPPWLRRFTLEHVLRSRPREFEHETTRMHDRGYDAGRIHFLLLQLRSGAELTPIELDMSWHGSSVTGLVVIDGHHRLVAHVLGRKRHIPASVSGLVSMIEWLRGERRKCPIE